MAAKHKDEPTPPPFMEETLKEATPSADNPKATKGTEVLGPPAPDQKDAPQQLAALTGVKGFFTIDRFFQFGGMSSKKSKRLVITITPTAGNTVSFGGLTNKFLASDVGFSVIESCSNLVVLTTNNNNITKIIPATPSPDGTYVGLADITATSTGAPADVTLSAASNEIAQIALDGY